MATSSADNKLLTEIGPGTPMGDLMRRYWFPALRADFPDLELHLIGPLQSNKAKEAVQHFDVIHTIDRDKIAKAIADEIKKQGRHPKLLVQVNTGEEPQKSGVLPKEADGFVALCRDRRAPLPAFRGGQQENQ